MVYISWLYFYRLASLGIKAVSQTNDTNTKDTNNQSPKNKLENTSPSKQTVTTETSVNVPTEKVERKHSIQEPRRNSAHEFKNSAQKNSVPETRKNSNVESRRSSFKESVFKYSSFCTSFEGDKKSTPYIRQYNSQKETSKQTVGMKGNPPHKYSGNDSSDWLNANNNHDSRKISSKDVIVSVDNETKVQQSCVQKEAKALSSKTNGIETRRKSGHSTAGLLLDERNTVQTSHA